MKKNLLWINAKLYASLCIVSLCYFGIGIGRHAQILSQLNMTDRWERLNFSALLLVAIYGVLWVIARYLHKEHILISGKSCLGMAVFTIGISLLMIIGIDFEGIKEKFNDPMKWYGGLSFTVRMILFVASLIICVNYIICAFQIRKENKAVGWKG